MKLAYKRTIEELKHRLVEELGDKISSLILYGSAAKGDMREESDIDVVVEFERGKATFRNVCGLIDFLEALFGRKVDILTLDGIESIRLEHVREEIKRSVEYA